MFKHAWTAMHKVLTSVDSGLARMAKDFVSNCLSFQRGLTRLLEYLLSVGTSQSMNFNGILRCRARFPSLGLFLTTQLVLYKTEEADYRAQLSEKAPSGNRNSGHFQPCQADYSIKFVFEIL